MQNGGSERPTAAAVKLARDLERGTAACGPYWRWHQPAALHFRRPLQATADDKHPTITIGNIAYNTNANATINARTNTTTTITNITTTTTIITITITTTA